MDHFIPQTKHTLKVSFGSISPRTKVYFRDFILVFTMFGCID
jgi:hypothetical protein